MKRVKETKKIIENKPQNKKDSPKLKPVGTSLLEKYFGRYTVFFLVFAIFLVGFIAFKDYFISRYLFFFTDIGSDSINQDLPAIIHSADFLGNSFLEKWSFYQGMGNAYYKAIPVEPLGFFSYAFDYVGYFLWGDNFFISGRFIRLFIFNFLFSGMIFYYYLRTISINKYSSFIGALFVTFSGYMVLGSSWGFSGHIFRAVFLLFAFEQLFVRKRWYFFPFAVIYASGNIFVLYIYTIFLFTYSLFRYFSSEENKIKGYFILTGKMIMLGAVGLLINAINVWRNFYIMFFSSRVSGNSSLSDKLISGNSGLDYTSHNATTILRFFSNDVLGSGINFKGWNNYFEAPAFYIGIFILVIFSQLYTLMKKKNAIIFGSFMAFWLISVFVPEIRYAILAYTGDYYRYGFDFFIPFVFLFSGIYSLNKIESGFKINFYTLGATITLLLILLYFPYSSIPENVIDENIRKIITFLLILYTGVIYFMSKKEYKQISRILLLAVVIFELSYFSYKSYQNRKPVLKSEYIINSAGYKDGTIKAVKYTKINDKKKFYRTTKDYQSGAAMHGSLNDAMAQGYYGTARYSSFAQINYVRFLEEIGIIPKGDETSTRWISGLRAYPLLQTFANVKYQLSKSKSPEFTRFGFEIIKKEGDISILRNKYYLPFGYSYDKYIDFDDYVNMKYYKLTSVSIQNINNELRRVISQEKTNSILTSLSPISNIKFDSDTAFISSLKKILSVDDYNSYKYVFLRNAVQNFRNQIALLTCFVNEKGENYIDTSNFMKLNPSDTSIFVDALYFNFDRYQKLVNELREDTFKIEKFEQSRIKGNINLSKEKLVFFTIPYDEAWKIKVNGELKVLKRVNVGFSGIALDKGEYKIELYYQPDYYQPAFIVTIISGIAFLVFLVFGIRRKKKSLE